MNAWERVQPVRTKLRIRLLIAAACVTIFAILHHVDHVIRGNHSGWPFQEAVTPFTFSLLSYALLLPGLYLTAKGGLMAGYWLFTAGAGRGAGPLGSLRAHGGLRGAARGHLRRLR